MGKKVRGATFADIVKEPTWSETEESAWVREVRPGRFNRAGTFFDPDGNPLTRAERDIGESAALALLAEGALVAFEGCCGGGPGGCEPQWIVGDRLERLRSSAGTGSLGGDWAFIESWTSATGTVVFVHEFLDCP